MKVKFTLVLALIIRLLLFPWGYHDDVITNYWWGKFALDFNLRGYYDWLNFGGYYKPDQPMLYILFYRTVRQIYLIIYEFFWFLNTNIPLFPSKFMQWYFEHGNQVLQKIPIILFDIILIYLVYVIVLHLFNKKTAQTSALLFSLYPPLIYHSAIWGSNDSMLNTLGLLAIYLYYKKRPLIASILFLTCLFFKSSLIIFVPIIMVIYFANRHSVTTIFQIVLIGLILTYFTASPFAPSNPIVWTFNLYINKILPGGMQQLTSNAMNIWGLIYGSAPINDNLIIFSYITARTISIIIFTLLTVVIVYKYSKAVNIINTCAALSLVALSSFMLLTRMHERYLFPSLIPLYIYTLQHKNTKLIFYILSATHLLNIYRGWWVPSLPLLQALLSADIMFRAISLVNTICFIYLLRHFLLSLSSTKRA